ncbi:MULTISPECIES: hypothetical protein [Desulfovibrio]|uniref:Uncharacterized protein n=1 Tax=Desulfovibrio desulfuricans TaxID=876 RepID=A0AA94HU91_DESDE|nr:MULTISPECIES: hypothetical protein [Desulfovibrio]ATD80935.1 hypothetical protein CNY67_05590 [Desulfovibrio sp. G11]SFW64351.1 hypothetical protein SAMN02910291_02255 [Desulfovibrio desulfuricans]SPD36500.1 Nucleotide-diphospho-sugar transferases [Desulfovibrio sp. G11]
MCNDGILKKANRLIKEKKYHKALVELNYFNDNCPELRHIINYNFLFIKNNIDYIVSLTSYPKRISTCHLVIESILAQYTKNIKVILWLAREEFPGREKDLPAELRALVSDEFSIEWCENIYSFKKLIPSLLKYPEKIIITADDDVIYPQNWLDSLITSYIHSPEAVHCHRAHRVKIDVSGNIVEYSKWKKRIKSISPRFDNFMTGVGGVLYPQNSLFFEVLRKDLFLDLCRFGDDIWFWAMCVLNGTKIRVVKDGFNKFQNIENTQDDNLWESNVNLGRNDIMINSVIERYPDILKKLVTSEDSNL